MTASTVATAGYTDPPLPPIAGLSITYKEKTSLFTPMLPPIKKITRGFSPKHASGFTLIEVAIAAVLSAAVAALLVSTEADNLRTQLAQNQGQLLATLNNAVNAYEAANFTALVNHTSVAGVANAYAPTLPELSTLGYLTAPFSAQNLYGGGYSVNLSLLPTGCISVNCNVGGLVALTTPVRDLLGRTDAAAAGAAMLAAGGDAAMSSATNPGTLAGANGSWTAVNPMGNVSGIVAMQNGYLSSSYASFVRRDGSLPMTGSLNVGGNNVTNANTVSANVVSAGTVSANAVSAGTVSATSMNTSALTASGITSGSVSTGSLYAANASLTNVSSGNLNNGGNVSTNTLNSNTVTSSGRISTNEYVQVGGTASVGSWCSPNGLLGQDGSGGILSCQNGAWGRFQTFERIQTIESTVDYYCTLGDPSNPPNYNYAQWSITCGSRFCQSAYGYGFGLITEFSGPGGNANQPYESSPGGQVVVSCSR